MNNPEVKLKAHDNIQKIMGEQLNLFYLALSFFTRIPIPQNVRYSAELLNKANRYFSLVGLLLASILAVCYWLISQTLPINVSVLVIMALSLLLTGAFHEDGLADMADGIGGAFNVEKRLAIMKDSRIGTYGSVTLILALALKFSLLFFLAEQDVFILICALFLGASLSRALAASLISSLPYVSEQSSSKSKPLAQSQSKQELLIVVIIGALPLILYSWSVALSCLLILLIFRQLFSRWLLAKIGGFTGDCLGAAQQIAELLIYFVLVAFLQT
ncbi:adenosylcobinamide-GDP ribazoletransferase [Candidatus Colwellia aromaticivorans]|uniref:adenosylcobinamide-GDP ribazoletransferase n=1 Tax=Candidatus Colwellia aromaticivorans TaxID=2267621 RepID=UPI001FE75705|nr:adenosylcobinamide-GDP ribazoletransferase [Candidatus Colwellia aromaticivorans]